MKSGADASVVAEAEGEHVTDGVRGRAPTSPRIQGNAGVAGRGAAICERRG